MNILRRSLVAFGLLLAAPLLHAQPPALSATERQKRIDSEKELQSLAIVERRVMVPMRDGVRLATDVYRPKNASGAVWCAGRRRRAWWGNTGSKEARMAAARRNGYSPEFDPMTHFMHDVPRDIAVAAEAHERPEGEIGFGEARHFDRWPAVPIHVIAGRDDRFFLLDFQRRVARERLHVQVEELPGGHLIALSNPRGLADQLLA
jgi:pimeloyl-ACP methyl ester carboxylesterase